MELNLDARALPLKICPGSLVDPVLRMVIPGQHFVLAEPEPDLLLRALGGVRAVANVPPDLEKHGERVKGTF